MKVKVEVEVQDDHERAWVYIKGVAVCVYPTDEGVFVDMFDARQLASDGDCESIASTGVDDNDLLTEDDV